MVSFREEQKSLGSPKPNVYTIKRLAELIEKNHELYSILFNNKGYHNHLVHTLTSACLIGASNEHLERILYNEGLRLIYWDQLGDSIYITKDNWTQYLGKREMEKSFFQFFSRELDCANWQDPLRDFLTPSFLYNGLFEDLLHPLIHLGYAQELNNRSVAIEALTLISVAYEDTNINLDSHSSCGHPSNVSDILDTLRRVYTDEELDTKILDSRKWRVYHVMEHFADKVLNYSNELTVDAHKPLETAKHLLHIGSLLFGAVHKDNDPQYDFILLHALTATHELINLLQGDFVPSETHETLIRHLWLRMLTVYIAQGRPSIKLQRISNYPIKSIQHAWSESVDLALTGECCLDIHIHKVVRGLLFTERLLNDDTGFYAKLSLQFTRSFTANGYAKKNGHQLDVRDRSPT